MEQISKLSKKSKLTIIISITIITVVVLLTWVAFNYSLVRITVAGSDGEVWFGDAMPGANKPELKKKATSSFLHIAKRSNRSIYISKDNKELVADIKLRPVWNKEIKLTLSSQAATNKAAGETLGCFTVMESVTVTYRCAGQSNLFKYERTNSDWSNKQLIEERGLDFKQPRNYREGLLSLNTEFDNSAGELFQVAYTTFGGSDKLQSTVVGAPTSIKDVNTDTLRLVVDSTDTQNEAFFVVDTASLVAYGFGSINDRTPIKITIAEKVKKDRLAFLRCTSINSILTCLYGRSSGETETKAEQKEQKVINTPITLLRYDIKNRNFEKAELPNELLFDEIQHLTPNTYLGLSFDRVLFVIRFDGSIQELHRFGLADGLAIGKKYALIKSGDKIYKLDRENPSQLNLAFSSTGLRTSRVSAYNNSYGFTAFVAGDNEQTIHGFSLYPDQELSGGRVEDKIAKLVSESGALTQLDYSGDTLFVRFQLKSYTSDHQTGRLIVDENEFAQRKAAFNSRLRNLNLDNQFKNIIYTF